MFSVDLWQDGRDAEMQRCRDAGTESNARTAAQQQSHAYFNKTVTNPRLLHILSISPQLLFFSLCLTLRLLRKHVGKVITNCPISN